MAVPTTGKCKALLGLCAAVHLCKMLWVFCARALNELEGMSVFLRKQEILVSPMVLCLSGKQSQKGDRHGSRKRFFWHCKGSTMYKQYQQEKNKNKFPLEENKHDIVRTSARVRSRSLVEFTSQVLSRCASKRHLRQRDQDKANSIGHIQARDTSLHLPRFTCLHVFASV